MSFDLSMYRETELERWINEKYRAAGISCAADLQIERLATIYDVEVRTYKGPSFAEWQDGEYSFLFLNNELPVEELREHFFHELCHPLRHVGRQDDPLMPPLFRQLQETQAEAFQLYASMPAYLLEEFTPYASQSNFLKILAESFMLPFKLVERRIRQILGRINQLRNELHCQKILVAPEPMPLANREIQIDDRTIIVMQDSMPSFLHFKVYPDDWDATLYINVQKLLNHSAFFLHGLDTISLPVPAVALVQHSCESNTIGVHMPDVSEFLGKMHMSQSKSDIDFLQVRLIDMEYILQRNFRFQYDW
ncbi:ImmA/IrrE family metallo-endopeptidase [Paenibacillus sp. MMS18-CY102]|uniref:ImmA/IrrE family metallo-endopeptidase n=1 Tax=Paenibacillus sp. MMS18-CY102 TaxID=2682849 RepID=UPI001365C060|nr:ImmA/IrrE family metallo-endopeptidase [Paenibacillus sp. MMS18-CY102]MWC26664.1 ImmA/IrrE family metallo-endopeptidase [Paenibacillus sp. MMS18-CY102]